MTTRKYTLSQANKYRSRKGTTRAKTHEDWEEIDFTVSVTSKESSINKFNCIYKTTTGIGSWIGSAPTSCEVAKSKDYIGIRWCIRCLV